jgi:hypothetical protein
MVCVRVFFAKVMFLNEKRKTKSEKWHADKADIFKILN